jgi:glycosyltransferase involved in cell wall biosynthesis
LNPDALLLVTTSFPQSGDGSEAAGGFVADLAQALQADGPVRVVAPGAREQVETLANGVVVHRFASPGRPLSLLSPGRPTDWPAIVSTLSSLRRQTLGAAQDGRVAHTLALWALPSGWAARALQRKAGVPYSVWALGSDIWSLGRLPLVSSVLRGVIGHAQRRYADGLQLADDARALSGQPFDFLPSSRLLSRARSRALATAPPYRLLFLGRWHPNKGVDLLLEALALLPPDTWAQVGEVRIAGGGPLEPLVHAQVGELKARGLPIRLDGFLDNAAATEALESSDFLLLPSRVESIPVIFSDAMKMRLPVLSMPVGDLPGLVADGGVGRVASAITARAFADCICAALHEPPARSEAALAAMAQRFAVEQSASRLRSELRPGAPAPGVPPAGEVRHG